MTVRRSTREVTFRHPFTLKGVDRVLPAGSYRVDTDEELIDGLSFAAWRRISTVVLLPPWSHPAGWSESVTVDPQELADAEARAAEGADKNSAEG